LPVEERTGTRLADVGELVEQVEHGDGGSRLTAARRDSPEGAPPARVSPPPSSSTMPKVVFSSTVTEPLAWPNTRLVRGDAVAAVRALRSKITPAGSRCARSSR